MDNIQNILYTQDLKGRARRILKKILLMAVFGLSLIFSSCTIHRGYGPYDREDGYYQQEGDYGYGGPHDRLEHHRWEREHRRWHRLHDRANYDRNDWHGDHDADDGSGIIIGR